jgi:hypothetical protein
VVVIALTGIAALAAVGALWGHVDNRLDDRRRSEEDRVRHARLMREIARKP